MLREVKYVVYLLTIFFFIFFVIKFYLSENNIKWSNRVILQYQNIFDKKFISLPIIKDDTNDIIEYTNEIDDFKKVTEKTKDNPVYYVQYCYARICSVFRNLNLDLNEEINFDEKKFHINSNERQIIKKLSEWPKCVSISTQRMEPHRIPVYLYELATLFHSYWNLGKYDASFRFISDNKPTSQTKLIILKSISYVVKSGMNLIGVNTPNKM